MLVSMFKELSQCLAKVKIWGISWWNVTKNKDAQSIQRKMQFARMPKNWNSVRGLESNTHRETIEHVFQIQRKILFKLESYTEANTNQARGKLGLHQKGAEKSAGRSRARGFCLTLSSTVNESDSFTLSTVFTGCLLCARHCTVPGAGNTG